MTITLPFRDPETLEEGTREYTIEIGSGVKVILYPSRFQQDAEVVDMNRDTREIQVSGTGFCQWLPVSAVKEVMHPSDRILSEAQNRDAKIMFTEDMARNPEKYAGYRVIESTEIHG
jgi:hypothetical protein